MWYLLSGIGFGILGGMGMGGGIILIPALTLLLSASQHTAQGLNLLAFLPMSAFALISHIKHKRISFPFAIIFSLSGALGAVLGALLASQINAPLLKKLFGGFLILLGGYRGIRQIISAKKKKYKGD